MHNRSPRPFVLLMAALPLLLAAVTARAADPPFRETMLGLLRSSQGAVEGIMREDYARVAAMAEAIAFHEGPSPNRRMAIFNELGIEAMSFTLLDDDLRTKARALKKAAEGRDQKAVIGRFGEVMQSCANCHNSYRKRLRTLR